MKKIIIFALVVMAAACSPLKIAIDTTSSEGERRVVTSGEAIMKVKDGKIYLHLGVKLGPKDTLMAVLASCDATTRVGMFNRGNQMKFRLADDSEITLFNILDKKMETHRETQVSEHYETAYGYAYSYRPWGRGGYVHPYQVTAMVPEVSTTQKSTSYALYLITRQQLIDIMEKGVTKFRIETESDDHDLKGMDAESISGVFKALRDCLLKAATKEKEAF